MSSEPALGRSPVEESMSNPLHSYTPISLTVWYTHHTMLRTTLLRSAAPSLRATTSRRTLAAPIAIRSVSTKQPTISSAPPPPALAGQFAPGEEIDPQRTSAFFPLLPRCACSAETIGSFLRWFSS